MKSLGLGLDAAITKAVPVQDELAPPGKTRNVVLGGSEIAAVIGVSPWNTALDIYFSKTGTRPPTGPWLDPQREKNFKRGHRAEPHGIDMAVEEYGLKVTKRSIEGSKNYHSDPEHAFMVAEIDFEWEVTADIAARFDLPEELVGTIQNGEVKSVHPFAAAKFGDAETDEVPVEYAAQAMWGLMVTGRQLTMFLVLTGWDDLTVYWIRRDDETIAGMRALALPFWNDHVLARVPPAPVNLPDVLNLFGRVGSRRVDTTEEIDAMIAELATANAEVRKWGDKADDAKYRIGCAILGKETMDNPADPGKIVVVKGAAPVLVIDFQQQYDLNESKLKALYPAVAEACAKMLQFFVFRIPRPKKDPAAKKAAKSTPPEDVQP